MDEEEDDVQFSRKRRNTVIDSSTDDETEKCAITPESKYSEQCQESRSTRSSARISKKRSRSFEMPTRESVWKVITPSKSAEKYQHLAPRKLVNNFTRENNRYNYDPVYTSGEESMEDFIVDTDTPSDSSSSSTDQPVIKKKGKHRVRNRKERVIVETSSETDSETEKTIKDETNVNEQTYTGEEGQSKYLDDVTNSSTKISKRKDKLGTSLDDSRHSNESGFEDHVNASKDDNEDSDSDEVIVPTPHRKRRKSNVINSESSEDTEIENSNELMSQCLVPPSELVPGNSGTNLSGTSTKGCTSNLELPERSETVHEEGKDASASSSSDGQSDVNEGKVVKKSCEKSETVKDEVDVETSSSDDQSGDDYESDESDDSDTNHLIRSCSSRTRVGMLKKKKEKLKLFEKIREERKRKLSKAGKSG